MQGEEREQNNPEPFQIIKNARKNSGRANRSRKQSMGSRPTTAKKSRKMTAEISIRDMEEEVSESMMPNSLPQIGALEEAIEKQEN